MTNEAIPVHETKSISNTLEKKNQQITQRAYELFESAGGVFGNDLDHWLTAERELLWRPRVELREKDNEFVLDMAAAGVNPEDIQIEVSPEDLVLQAEIHHEHEHDRGQVHHCEFESGALFRTINFPKKIDTRKVKAEFRNGMLHIKAPVDGQVSARAASDAA